MHRFDPERLTDAEREVYIAALERDGPEEFDVAWGAVVDSVLEMRRRGHDDAGVFEEAMGIAHDLAVGSERARRDRNFLYAFAKLSVRQAIEATREAG